MNFPSREIVEEIRKRYPKGSRVALVFMDDAQAPPVGTLGTIGLYWSSKNSYDVRIL